MVGGPLQPDRPSYVFRAADRQLRERLRAREFCHVLAPLHMGKTSLMAQTAFWLRADGCDIATLDLEEISGHGVAEDVGRWYYSFAYRVVRELRIRVDLASWWQERSVLTIRQRLRDFFLEVVVSGTSRPVVIFLDRIEAVSHESAALDLFEAIRSCFDSRATEPEYQRLSFALLGASGAERPLTHDQDGLLAVSSPVVLGDFTDEELGDLVQGLGLPVEMTAAVARRIGYWTAGHPYLSQKICLAVARNGFDGSGDAAVDDVVGRLFLRRNALRQDTHLSALGASLTQPRSHAASRLTVYGRVCKGQVLAVDDSSTAHCELLDSGLVVDNGGTLAVRNRIYSAVFTALWVNRNLPFSWRAVAAAAALLVVMIAVPVGYRDYLPRPFVSVLKADDGELLAAHQAWGRLRLLPGFRGDADRLFQQYLMRQSRRATRLSEARRMGEYLGVLSGDESRAAVLLGEFWDRRAALMAQRGDRDGALLYTLESLAQSTPERELRLAELLGDDFPLLAATLRPGAVLTDLEIDAGKGLLTTLDRDHEVVVWRIGTGTPDVGQRLTLGSGETPPPQSSVLGPGGQRALAWSVDGAAAGDVLVWDVVRARVLSRLPSPAGLLEARFVLGHSAVLLTGESSLELRDAQDGRLLRRLPLPAGVRPSPVLSGNGRYLVLHTEASPGVSALALWDLDGPTPVGRIVTGSRAAVAAADGRGTLVAVGDEERLVRVWRVRGQVLHGVCKHVGVPIAAEFDPSGRYLATQDDAGRFQLWDLARGCRLVTGRQGNGAWHLRFAPDGSAVAMGNFSRGFELLQLPGGERLGPTLRPGIGGGARSPAGPAAGVRFLPDRSGLLTYDGRGAVKLWSMPARESAGVAAPWSGTGPIAASPDRHFLALGTVGGDVQILPLTDEGPLSIVPDDGLRFLGHRSAVTRLAFSASGELLASGALNGSLRVWEVASGKPRNFFAIHGGGAVEDLAFLPDGSAVVSANRSSVLLLDAKTGAERVRLSLETTQPRLAVAPDGSFVLIAGDYGVVTRWDWRSGTVSTFGEADDQVRRIALSDDGQLLATAGADRTVRLWRLPAGEPQRRSFTAQAAADGLWFSADGRSLLVQTGAWLHFLDIDTAGLRLRRVRALPDADARVIRADRGDWRLLVISGRATPQVMAVSAVQSWAQPPADPLPPSADQIRARLRLRVDAAGELQPM